MNNNIPPEFQEELHKKCQDYTAAFIGIPYRTELGIAYADGMAEYAIWKVRYDQAERLLDKVMARHEAGLLPDMHIYNEIKSFLDGK